MMNIIGLLVLMAALHIFEDFHLQGIMASMKQKSWWDSECAKSGDPRILRGWREGRYGNDWIPALLLHGFGWAVCVTLPMMWELGFDLPVWFGVMLLANALAHSCIDHFKANLLRINLVQDQCLHMVQILEMAAVYTLMA